MTRSNQRWAGLLITETPLGQPPPPTRPTQPPPAPPPPPYRPAQGSSVSTVTSNRLNVEIYSSRTRCVFSLMPAAISCRSVDASSSERRAARPGRGNAAGAGHAHAPVGRGKCGRWDRKRRGVLAKSPGKGSISWSTSRAPSVFVWLRVPLVIGHIVQQSVIQQREGGTGWDALDRDSGGVPFRFTLWSVCLFE